MSSLTQLSIDRPSSPYLTDKDIKTWSDGVPRYKQGAWAAWIGPPAKPGFLSLYLHIPPRPALRLGRHPYDCPSFVLKSCGIPLRSRRHLCIGSQPCSFPLSLYPFTTRRLHFSAFSGCHADQSWALSSDLLSKYRVAPLLPTLRVFGVSTAPSVAAGSESRLRSPAGIYPPGLCSLISARWPALLPFLSS